MIALNSSQLPADKPEAVDRGDGVETMRQQIRAEFGGGLPLAYPDLGHAYQLLRAGTAITILVLALALALAWERPELVWVGGAAAVAAVDAALRSRRSNGSPSVPLALDTVAVGVAMIFGGLPLAVMGSPFAYLVTAALLLLPPRRALRAVLHTSGWVVAALAVSSISQVNWTSGQELVLGGIAAAVFFTEMALLIWVAARVLRDRQEALAKLVRSKDEFVASVSHELRTPLTGVLGFARELRDHKGKLDPREESEILDLLVSEAQEVADIVDDLLTAARLQVGTVSIKPEKVALDVCARELLQALGEYGSHVTVEGAGACWADPLRLRQILRNLLTNAQRYGGTDIMIRIAHNSQQTHVEVTDNGAGIPAEATARAFEPYEQAHHDRGQPHSVGLGLFVGRALARLMNGDLTYERREGLTTFDLSLPANPPPV
jgi:signal transduction histidine kinase